jgi:tetratricopeptide (TPR) repeat protein
LLASPMSTTRVDNLIASASTAFDEERVTDAEQLLRQALAEDTENLQVRWFLGLILEQQRKYSESVFELTAVCEKELSQKALVALARVQISAKDFLGAEQALERLESLSPHLPGLHVKLAKLKSIRKDYRAAHKCLLRGLELNPSDVDSVLAIADFADFQESKTGSAIEYLTAFLDEFGDEPRKASPVLRRLLEIQNQQLRTNAYLPRDTALSWSDTLSWLDTVALEKLQRSLLDELQQSKVRAEALIDLGSIAVEKADWKQAAYFFSKVKSNSSNHVSSLVEIEQSFWDSISNSSVIEINSGWPAVTVVSEGVPRRLSLLLACDPIYFERFGIRVLEQLRSLSPDCHAHVHLLDGDEPTWDKLAKQAVLVGGAEVTITAERPGFHVGNFVSEADYYHSVRYLRLFNFVQTSMRPYWMMDVDATVLHDPLPLLGRIFSQDIAIRGNAGSLLPWHKIAGCLVGIAPTERGLEFIRSAAAFISYWKKCGKLCWGIDQLALFLAFNAMFRNGRQPDAWFIDGLLLSINGAPPGAAMNFISGRQKFLQL